MRGRAGMADESGWVGAMESFLKWLEWNGTVLAVLVTAGVAVLLVCCLGCSNCGNRKKDDLFNRHEV